MRKHENTYPVSKIVSRGDPDRAAAYIERTLDLQEKQTTLLEENRKRTTVDVIVFRTTRVLPDIPERRAA